MQFWRCSVIADSGSGTGSDREVCATKWLRRKGEGGERRLEEVGRREGKQQVNRAAARCSLPAAQSCHW